MTNCSINSEMAQVFINQPRQTVSTLINVLQTSGKRRGEFSIRVPSVSALCQREGATSKKNIPGAQPASVPNTEAAVSLFNSLSVDIQENGTR